MANLNDRILKDLQVALGEDLGQLMKSTILLTAIYVPAGYIWKVDLPENGETYHIFNKREFDEFIESLPVAKEEHKEGKLAGIAGTFRGVPVIHDEKKVRELIATEFMKMKSQSLWYTKDPRRD